MHRLAHTSVHDLKKFWPLVYLLTEVYDYIAASGEPPLLLAVSVHCATRAAIKEARKQLHSWKNSSDQSNVSFQLDVPATMPVVKRLCGMDYVESYLQNLLSCQGRKQA